MKIQIPYPTYFDGDGTESVPFRIDNHQYWEIKEMLHQAEKEYMAASPPDKTSVRAQWRSEIVNRFPQLFDNAHLKVI